MPKLKRSVLFYYSLADMPVMMSIFPALVFIPQFYASEMGVSLIAVANITLAVRIFDFLTDPLMGQISDRVRTPWGRRRPWLVCATPLMMVGIYMLYMPPADTQVGTGYMLVWMLVISLGTTMMLIPYYAWGAELSPDYNERTRITGARAISGQSGQMLAQFAPTVALLAFGIGGNRAVLAIVGVTMLCLMPICVWLTVSRAPDGPVEESAALPVLQGFRLMFRNGPFLWLALVFLISTCGLAMTTPLYLFFVADVLGDRERAIYVLFFFYLTSILAVPFWVWLSRHIGKHRGYMAALLMIAVSHPFYLLLGEGDLWWMLPITLITGFASGGFSMSLPYAMKADVIDLDTLRSGENRAASFFSAWSLLQKGSAALGAWFGLFVLGLVGYQAELGATNTAEAEFGLRFLFSTFPSFFYVLAAALVWFYPITEARHAELRAEIEGCASEQQA